MIARVKIPENSFLTEIEADGQRIENAVRALTIDASATTAPLVRLELAIGTEIDVVGKLSLRMTAEVRNALIVLGWTPPEETR